MKNVVARTLIQNSALRLNELAEVMVGSRTVKMSSKFLGV